MSGLNAEQLEAAIKLATSEHGWAMHPSKKVLLRVDGKHHRLDMVTIGFVDGAFALILTAADDGDSG